jgi:ribosomal protein S18 acetylase RimI-like enzyme
MFTVIDGTRTHLDAAARIWAEATSARDADEDVPPFEISRRIIERVLESSPRAFLLVALSDDGEAAGFAAIAPDPDEAGVAELHYIGVSPRGWGRGVGNHLMSAIPLCLKERGFSAAKLHVYIDNERAIRLYERLGWRRHGSPSPPARSGRLEQEYRLAL